MARKRNSRKPKLKEDSFYNCTCKECSLYPGICDLGVREIPPPPFFIRTAHYVRAASLSACFHVHPLGSSPFAHTHSLLYPSSKLGHDNAGTLDNGSTHLHKPANLLSSNGLLSITLLNWGAPDASSPSSASNLPQA